jgi:hypothetical protein
VVYVRTFCQGSAFKKCDAYAGCSNFIREKHGRRSRWSMPKSQLRAGLTRYRTRDYRIRATIPTTRWCVKLLTRCDSSTKKLFILLCKRVCGIKAGTNQSHHDRKVLFDQILCYQSRTQLHRVQVIYTARTMQRLS